MARKKYKVWIANFQDSLKVHFYPFGVSFGDLYDYAEDIKYERGYGGISLDEVKDQELVARIEKMRKDFCDIHLKVLNNQKIDPKLLPTALWAKKYPVKWIRNKEPSAFRIGLCGFAILSGKGGDILQEARCGENQISELRGVYSTKTREKISDDRYFFLNVCEHRQFLLPEYFGKYIRRPNELLDKYRISYPETVQKELILRDEVLDCDVDLWHDPIVDKCIFVSDRVYRALKEANAEKEWKFTPCRLLSDIK